MTKTPPVLSDLKRMSRQRITIDVGGGVLTLEYKPGKGVDTKQLGKADVKRSTDITWCADDNAWKVKWLDFGMEGYMTYQHYLDAVYAIGNRSEAEYLRSAAQIAKIMESLTKSYIENDHGPRTALAVDGEARFATYEDAVNAEIDVIEGLALTDKTVRL